MELWNDIKAGIVDAQKQVFTGSPCLVEEAYAVGRQAKLLGEGVVAAGEDAVNGATQFINHSTDAINNIAGTHIGKIGHLELLSNREEVDHSTAGKIGEYAGTAFVFLGTVATVSELAAIEACGAGCGAIAAAIQGGILTPTKETTNKRFFVDRIEDGAIAAAAVAVASKVGDLALDVISNASSTPVLVAAAGVGEGLSQGVNSFVQAEGKALKPTVTEAMREAMHMPLPRTAL